MDAPGLISSALRMIGCPAHSYGEQGL